MKGICSCCKRTLRKKSLKINKLTKQLVCSRCDNKIGSNKFYCPGRMKSNFIGKYSISELEKKVLNKMKNKKQIEELCNGLRIMRKKASREKIETKQKEKIATQNKKELNEKFLTGLK